MLGPKPVRVECSTCSSHHNYRASVPGERTVVATGSVRTSAAPRASSPPRAPRGPTRAAQAEMEREKTWEKAIAGKGMSDFRVYRVSHVFKEGDLVRHSKFGDGVVTRIIDQNKVEVLFKDKTLTLAQGLAS
jgi:hypothetical protein